MNAGLRLLLTFSFSFGLIILHTRLEFSVVVVPAAGGEEKELFSALGPMGDVALDWSPDGSAILENSETLTHGRFLLGLLPIAAAPTLTRRER